MCSSGTNKALLRLFLQDQDFNPNQRNLESANTGLHMACHNGRFSLVQSILDVKRKVVNLNIENGKGLKPLMVVAARGDKGILQRLLKETKLKLKNALSICEEMTKRGLLLRDSNVLPSLNRCAKLATIHTKNGLNEGQRKKSFEVYKRLILQGLREEAENIAVEENLSQERVREEL